MTTLADVLTVGDSVRLTGAIDTYAIVLRRVRKGLVVRWHGQPYIARGELEAGTTTYRVTTWEPWQVATPPAPLATAEVPEVAELTQPDAAPGPAPDTSQPLVGDAPAAEEAPA